MKYPPRDDVLFEALERSFGDLLDVLRPAIEAPLGSPRRKLEAELGCDHHLVTKGRKGFAHEFFVGERAIGLGCIKKGDATVHGRPNQGLFVGLAVLIATVVLRELEIAHGTAPLFPPKAQDGLFVIVAMLIIVLIPYVIGSRAARLLWRSRIRRLQELPASVIDDSPRRSI